MPSIKTNLLAKMVVRICFYAFISYAVVRFAVGFTDEGWRLIFLVGLSVATLALVARGYRGIKSKMREKGMLKSLSLIEAFEKLISAILLILLGVILYREWLEDPIHAYILFAMFCFFYVLEFLKTSNEQDAAHISCGSAPFPGR